MVSLAPWIDHPEQLNSNTLYELRMVLARYPYFQAARLLYIQNLYILHDAAFGAELRKAALYVTDRRALYHMVEGRAFIATTPPPTAQHTEEPTLDRTLALIDAFLATAPAEQPQSMGAEELLLADYAAYLLTEAELPPASTAATPPMRGQQLIDNFIEKRENGGSFNLSGGQTDGDIEPMEMASFNPENGENSGYFTETLAKIYIKQHKYEKALEIIKSLSLNYPKKCTYFAHQIRFIEKIIINEKHKLD